MLMSNPLVLKNSEPLTVDLDVYEPRCDQSIVAVGFHGRLLLLIEEHLFWVDYLPTSHPQVLLDNLVIPENPTVHELLQLPAVNHFQVTNTKTQKIGTKLMRVGTIC